MRALRGPAWTIVFLPGDDTESHSFRVRRGTALLAGGSAIALLLLIGWMSGWVWAAARESATMRELSAEVERLSLERTQMMELAARLERMEVDYRRLQRVLGGSGSQRTESEIWLPPIETESGEAGEGAARPEGALLWPLAQRGYITRSHRADEGPAHAGIDIAVPAGSYVRASARGVVADVGENGIYGRFVRIDHADELSTLYGHNAWTFVAEGDSVEVREVIALSGTTGQSTGPHLHFETRRAGRMIDPLELVGP
ncbi:MAG: M23 family metallopeptidase [Gemmatimonadota bacterium]|nr:MAG: M23 family metallopeptidase [Gemmatimonadota bacterium]